MSARLRNPPAAAPGERHERSGIAMTRDVTSLIRPATIAVIGASAQKRAQGNAVIDNLLSRDCRSRIIPVHRSAGTIQGLATVAAIDDLPDGVDLAVASVPAAAAVAT
ncbi:MAG TPA: CoA-binding protein, partial [Thalassobaculum sp.]